MFPTLSLFGNTISMYALIAIAAGLLIGIMYCRRIRRLGYDDNDAVVMLLMAAGGAVLGGSLLYAVTHLNLLPDLLQSRSPREAFTVLSQMFGGLVYYGGLCGALLAGILYLRIKKLDQTTWVDAVAPLIPLFHGISRIGCFCGGCCYGIPSSFGFTVQNNPYIPAVNGVKRFPVQCLEAAGELLIFILLQKLYLKIWGSRLKGEIIDTPFHPMCGFLLPLYLLLYAVLRFFDEFLRGDDIRGFVFGGALSTSQFISLLVIAAVPLWFWIRRRSLKKATSGGNA